MASIADVYVTLLPETGKLADGIKRALLGLDGDMRKAGQRWGKEIQQGIKDVTVDVKADTKPAKKELEKLEKEKHTATVEVEVDGAAKAEAKLDAVARDRRVEVKVDVDKGAGAAGVLGDLT